MATQMTPIEPRCPLCDGALPSLSWGDEKWAEELRLLVRPGRSGYIVCEACALLASLPTPALVH